MVTVCVAKLIFIIGLHALHLGDSCDSYIISPDSIMLAAATTAADYGYSP
jgi:hypothetical protein